MRVFVICMNKVASKPFRRAARRNGSASKSMSRAFSSIVLDGIERAPSRGMLYATGFKKEDFKKSQIGVASTWSMVTPCNMHIDQLAVSVAQGINDAGGKAVVFNTITISDGISMGTEGMKYSLVSREVIADSIETVVGCQGFDGFVAIGGCDKNMPGCMMAIGRLNRPSLFVYGGTILPGTYDGRDVDLVSIFEAVGKNAAGACGAAEVEDIAEAAIPGAGSCGGMYTANTMASAIEALGMSLPNSSAQAAISKEKTLDCEAAGKAVLNLIKRGIRPRDIMTKEAFENAMTLVIALGGSTNAVMHLIAMAHSAGVKLTLDDWTRVGKRVPVLADLPVRRIVRGVYDNTPDRRPILGPAPHHPGLFLAAGFSGHGFMVAPAVGELVAAAIAGGPEDPLLAAFSLARFARPGDWEREPII